MASPPQAEVTFAPEPSGKGSEESAIEVKEVDEQGLVEDLFRGDSNTSEIAVITSDCYCCFQLWSATIYRTVEGCYSFFILSACKGISEH